MRTDRLRSSGRLAYAGQVLALASVYIVVGKVGLMMAPVDGFASLVWPPAGVSLAALLLRGYHLWPGVAIGAFATNLWIGAPALVASAIAVGNTLQVVAGAVAMRSIPGFRGSLDRFTEVVHLAVLAGVVSAAISPTVGVTSLTLGGVISAAHFSLAWRAWWTGDVIGILIIAPLLLTWVRGPRMVIRPLELTKVAALGAVLIACAVLIFVQRPETITRIPILQPYVLFLPLIWAALCYGVRGAATGTFVVAIAAVWGTYTGHGAFVRADQAESLSALAVFLASMSLASLVLGSIVSERRAEELFRTWLAAIVDSSADPVIGKTLEGTITSFNAAAEQLYGYTRAEVIGRPLWMLVPPERRDELIGLFDRIRRGERVANHETVRSRKDGTRVDIALTLSPVRDAAGMVIGVSAIERDITEQKQVESALRESEERQRLAVEAARLGMWFWEVKVNRLVWTPLCRSMHGIGPDEEVSYTRFLALLHPEDRERTERAIARSVAERTVFRSEHRVVWPDGSIHWISGIGRALYDEAGDPERMLGIAIDITSQKVSEQERAELLRREQAARAEAQAATQAKDEFLAVLSHELRTPLQSMLGWTQMLKAPGVDQRTAQKGLLTIERNVKMQAQLIEDLLDVSRIVAGKLRLSCKPVGLEHVIVSAVDLVKAPADAKSIWVEVMLEPMGGEVMGDPARLQQVVLNLLTNAVKFTPSRGRIGVRLEREGTMSRIIVEDTGCGIAPSFLPHVFDRFRQAESTTMRSYGGLGLGLAIVRHLVALHGGTVRAESPGEGQGSTFIVTLPVLASAERLPAAAVRRESMGSLPPVSMALDRLRVLVVDDDVDGGDVLMAVLQKVGADVCAARSARAALEAIGVFRPDVLISDIGMPEKDGYALIREVRARESVEGGHVLAVALTAFASRADGDQALAFGFEAHVAKPIGPEEIVRLLVRLLERGA